MSIPREPLFRHPALGSYKFEAKTRFDQIFQGVSVARPEWMPLEVDVSDEDAVAACQEWEADFGRLLERAAQRILAKEVASPAPPSWNQIAEFLQTMRRLRESIESAA